MLYKIVCGYTQSGRERVRKFPSLDAATKYAQAIFKATGVIVGIEENPAPKPRLTMAR